MHPNEETTYIAQAVPSECRSSTSSHRRYDVVVFDLDGTLVDSSADLTAALNYALQTLGRPQISAEQVRHLCGEGARAMITHGLSSSGPCEQAIVDQGVSLFLDFYRENLCVGTKPYDGLPAALERLKSIGIRLAVCTNKSAELAGKLIDALGWTALFDTVVGGDTLLERKPNPAPLVEAIARAGGGRGIFVGDTIVDADCARAANLPFVAVSFGFNTQNTLTSDLDTAITHFDELADALERCA